MRLTHRPDPVRFSLLVLTVIVLGAASGLIITSNWPKLLRVTLAAAGYLGTLTAWSRFTTSTDEYPWWPFASAGGLAGAISGIFQPVFSIPVLVTQIVTGALLLGTVHWLAVGYGRATRDRLFTSRFERHSDSRTSKH